MHLPKAPYSLIRYLRYLCLLCASTISLVAETSQAGKTLFDLNKEASLAELKTNNTTLSIAENTSPPKIEAVFGKGGYPKIAFPCPTEGLNLKNFKGIAIEVTNQSAIPVRAAMRIDNPGDEKEQFWNKESVVLKPGETKTIKSVFGQNNGKPGYPIDTSRITAYQLFLVAPKEDIHMLVGEPKAYGTPSEEQKRVRLSNPEDRNKTVSTPKWLGERPPVKGDWVITLDEDFAGDALNASVWGTRLAIVGPAREESQRYIDENVTLKDGVVTLKAEVNPGHQYNDSNLKTRKYAAGMLSSYDRWTQRYGYIEMRAKLPTTRGLSPVFSIIPDRGGDTGLNMHERRTSHDFNGKGMEMDVFTHLSEWGPGRIGIGTRWGGPAGTHIQKNWGDSYLYYGPTDDGWHTFGLLWEPNKLTWYVDGIKKAEWESDAIADVTCYLAVTMPMGRRATKNVDEANLPDTWDIDYIRVWQLADQ